MKGPILVLSFLILLLNGIPCCSFDDCEEEVAVEQPNHQEEPCDSCSPFLSCGTCQGFVVQYNSPQLSHRDLVPGFETLGDQDFFYSEYISSIWQPPQFI